MVLRCAAILCILSCMKKLVFLIFAVSMCAAFAKIDYKKFANPPEDCKPWAYWLWLNGNVDKQSITQDLEAMKEIGLSGMLFLDNRGYWEDDRHLIYPKPLCEHMSNLWLENLRHAVSECERLGLKLSVNLSSCGGNLKGPWKLGGDAPKHLVYKLMPLDSFNGVLPSPNPDFSWNVATFAIRYEGERIHESEWISAGDGAYSMAATSGKSINGESNALFRKALSVVDLSDRIREGKINWKAPEDGNWCILQISYTLLKGRDYDVDILDKNAVTAHYNRFIKEFKKRFPQALGKTISHFYNVSWEGSVPTWSHGFDAFFKKDRGYDIRKWLPALCGFKISSDEEYDRFITDFRRARNNCFRENLYKTLGDLAHGDGVKWHSESGGPWVRKPQVFGEADQLSFLGLNDMPQGEFWEDFDYDDPQKEGRYLIRPIASAARIYGKKLVAQEAFTHMQGHWSMYPSLLKFFGDKSFILGANFSILHTFTSSPDKYGLPGIEYFAGTHFNRNVTWHKQSAEFIRYIARCQYMLRYGNPRSDFCLYEGDVPYDHWYGQNYWNGKIHRMGKKGADKFYPLKFDTINNEILLGAARVENGLLKLDSGMTYKALYVDLLSDKVSPAALKRILEFKKAGLPVFCNNNKPTSCAGLGENNEAIADIADNLWDGADFGKFAKEKLTPSCEGDFEYIARRGENDVFFLVGQGRKKIIFDAKGIPELWNAVDGSRFAPDKWRRLDDGRTEIELSLPKHGSIFVVFADKSHAAPALPAPKNSMEICGPWSVSFQKGRGAPDKILMDSLVDLTKHGDFGVRHFSGEASYSNTIKLDAIPSRAELTFDEVNNLAEIYVNGEKAATLWTYPFKCDIAKYLKKGSNTLEIKVVNTWRNRLIGDCYMPPDKKITKSNVRTRNCKRDKQTIFSGYCMDDPLYPSGLAGKVKLLYE